MDKKTLFLLVAVFLVSFVINAYFLSRFPLVLGHDGAYYLGRLEQFKLGTLADSIVDTPPVFFALAAFFSNFFEANLSINLTAALFGVLLGISVFLLARLLLKDDWIALATALLVLFSRQEIILLTELKKNIAGLFFVPLFFYFFFKAGDKKKYLVPAIAIAALGFLTHKASTGICALVLLAFVPMQLAFERKQTAETKNFAILALVALLAFSIIFLFSEKTALGVLGGATNWLNETRDAKADINLSGYGIVFLAALAGLLCCFWRAKRQHLFFASWFLVGLWAAFPFVSGSASWRFALMLILPVAFLAGVLLQEIKERFGAQKFFLAFAVLLAFSLLFYFSEMNGTKAVFSPADYNALQELNGKLESQKPCVVFSAGTTFYWAEYLLKNCAAEAVDFPSIGFEAQRLSAEGKKAFVLADANPEKLEIEMFDSNSFAEFARSGTRVLFVPKPGKELQQPMQELPRGYNLEKLSNPLALLFLPTELPLLFNAPFALFLRVFFGIPAAFAIFGIILFFLRKKFLIPNRENN